MSRFVHEPPRLFSSCRIGPVALQSNRQGCRFLPKVKDRCVRTDCSPKVDRNTGLLQLLDPPSLDASIYNDFIALLTRHPEAIEDTLMPNRFPVFGFSPAIKIIGRTIGKIFNRLYAV